jgi:hypothetical protein
MAKRPARGKAADHSGNARSKHEPDPRFELYRALNDLYGHCAHPCLFQQVTEQRKAAFDGNCRLWNQRMADAGRRADAQQAKGVPFKEAYAEMEELDRKMRDALTRPPPLNEPDSLHAMLGKIIAQALAACERARAALRSGGARDLDQAMSPGGRAQSLAISTKLNECTQTLERIKMSLANPMFLLEELVARMASLGEWMGARREELWVLLDAPELFGGERNDDSGAWREAAWFSERTSLKIKAEALRKAGERGKLKQRRAPNGKFWQYRVSEVAKRYPGLANKLEI